MRAKITNPEAIVELAIANEVEAARNSDVPSREVAKRIMQILTDISADFRQIRPRQPRNTAAGTGTARGRRARTQQQ
ncbi:MAG: hypothetical protein IMX00_11130 [Limnochordales bacterium]|nr:hypothetical protein [Limnochordales bacterium]